MVMVHRLTEQARLWAGASVQTKAVTGARGLRVCTCSHVCAHARTCPCVYWNTHVHMPIRVCRLMWT